MGVSSRTEKKPAIRPFWPNFSRRGHDADLLEAAKALQLANLLQNGRRTHRPLELDGQIAAILIWSSLLQDVVDVGKLLAADERTPSKTVAKPGHADKGDLKKTAK